jgi:hypothetical protein
MRQGNYGEATVSELQPKYYENSLRGNTFTAAQTTGEALINLAAGGATFVLFNPTNSGRNLILQTVVVTVTSITGGNGNAAILLGGNTTGTTQTLTTPLIVYNTVVGSTTAGVGKALSSSTFSNTAVGLRYLGSWVQGNVTTPATWQTLTYFKDDVAGEIVIPPGSYVGVYDVGSLTLADAAIATSMSWTELNATVL